MDYYGDIEKTACAWMRALIAAELVPGGIVDDRPIQEVTGDELRDYRRCHFFAGIAGWAEALRLAQWPDDLPVWTGSCPCQPFSSAGKQKGTADERHVWPEFRRLIDECRPSIVFGEQVASKLGREWLASVRADLEALGYAVGASDLCAASVGAPHIRQRLYWVAYADSAGSFPRWKSAETAGHGSAAVADGGDCWLGNTNSERARRNGSASSRTESRSSVRSISDTACSSGTVGRMADTGGIERRAGSEGTEGRQSESDVDGSSDGLGNSSSSRLEKRISTGRVSKSPIEAIASEAIKLASNHWADVEWLACADGKTRPVKPGLQLLASGVQGRVAQLRGLGNAIVPQVAATFVKSCFEVLFDERKERTSENDSRCTNSGTDGG